MMHGFARDEVVRLMLAATRAPDQPHPGGATGEELRDLERRMGRSLPVSLLEWLRVCKGEAIGPGGVYGARPDRPHLDIARVLSGFPGWRDAGWIPVAGDGCGGHYILVTSGDQARQVAFVDQADTTSIDYVVASGLWPFLSFILRRGAGEIGWPFDQQMVLAADPAMASSPGSLLPWNREA
jgi:cell wall assembly regulator SMI1